VAFRLRSGLSALIAARPRRTAVDGGWVGDGSEDDIDAVGRPVRRHLVRVADVGDYVVSGLEEVVDDEAADGAGGAGGSDFRDKAPASVVVVARRTTWRDVTRTVQ
jgi:hypothetical protein